MKIKSILLSALASRVSSHHERGLRPSAIIFYFIGDGMGIWATS